MSSFVTVLHVVLCLFMVVVVLLQTGKSDMGAAFGGASQTVFGAGGAVSFLGKVTTATAVLFMCTSIYLAYSSNRAVRSGSVLEGLDEQI
jgi:preprotein translocase subunit SecG